MNKFEDAERCIALMSFLKKSVICIFDKNFPIFSLTNFRLRPHEAGVYPKQFFLLVLVEYKTVSEALVNHAEEFGEILDLALG